VSFLECPRVPHCAPWSARFTPSGTAYVPVLSSPLSTLVYPLGTYARRERASCRPLRRRGRPGGPNTRRSHIRMRYSLGTCAVCLLPQKGTFAAPRIVENPALRRRVDSRKQCSHASGNGPKWEWVQVGIKARTRRRADSPKASATRCAEYALSASQSSLETRTDRLVLNRARLKDAVEYPK
jgi:hypothetical protein